MKYRIFFLTQPDLRDGKVLTVLQPDNVDSPVVPDFNSVDEAYQYIKAHEDRYRSLPVTVLPFVDLYNQ